MLQLFLEASHQINNQCETKAKICVPITLRTDMIGSNYGVVMRFTVVSRMVIFPSRTFPGKTFSGWSFSPDETISYD